MVYRTFESQLDFENFIEENLNYEIISNMTFEEYKRFVFFLFKQLNKLKINGLERNNISVFVNNHYSKITSSADEDDILFERRFSSITEELNAFCSDPIFWYSDFSLYIKKWEKMFEGTWYKNV